MAPHRIRRNLQTRQVILDSSALLMLFEFSLNLDSELTRLLGVYDVVIPLPIIDELKTLSQRGDGRKSRMAHAALQLAQTFAHIAIAGKGDDALMAYAQTHACIIITNDKALRKRLKEIPRQVIFLRNKKTLVIE